MVNKSPNKRLREGLDKQKSHPEDGPQRIRAWYSDDHDPPDDFQELEQPPHQSLLEESAALIESATRPLDRGRQETGRLERDAELILYGVGVEKLLTGIYLQLEPNEFIAHMDNQGGHTPPFGECKRPLLNDLGSEIPSEQHGMVKAMLNIVQEHRNNEVHSGFHQYGQAWFNRLTL